jgi:L-2-hydroxycarboxylate dehydrogenase (NAD+)
MTATVRDDRGAGADHSGRVHARRLWSVCETRDCDSGTEDAHMNIPPETFRRVPSDALRDLAVRLGLAAGLSSDRAELLADLLSANDLRGVVSHGTGQLATYVRLLRDGTLNPDPRPEVVRETPTSLLVDGDGGLGYFPAYVGTRQLITKAEDAGIAVLVTRNHGHFGAAGLYSRLTLEHDLLSFVTSGHQLDLHSGDPVYAAAGGSPMSFSAPTADEPALVLDFGAMHDLYEDSSRDLLAELAPGLVHRSIGLGMVCQSWGGLLADVPLDPGQARRRWPGANQGSMVIALRIDLFTDPVQFKTEMDAYARAVRTLTPIPGAAKSYLPGGPEAEAESDYRAHGVPVGLAHQRLLEQAAAELGESVPWSSPPS